MIPYSVETLGFKIIPVSFGTIPGGGVPTLVKDYGNGTGKAIICGGRGYSTRPMKSVSSSSGHGGFWTEDTNYSSIPSPSSSPLPIPRTNLHIAFQQGADDDEVLDIAFWRTPNTTSISL